MDSLQFDWDAFLNSPSRKAGLSTAVEWYLRINTCVFMQELAQSMRDTPETGRKPMPTSMLLSACAYVHAFYFRHSFTDYNRFAVAVAALVLACKITPTPKSVFVYQKRANRALVEMALKLWDKLLPHTLDKATSGSTSFAHRLSFWERMILKAEVALIITINGEFDVNLISNNMGTLITKVARVHKLDASKRLRLAELSKKKAKVLQKRYQLTLLRAYFRSPMCVIYPADIAAAALLFLAVRRHNGEIRTIEEQKAAESMAMATTTTSMALSDASITGAMAASSSVLSCAPLSKSTAMKRGDSGTVTDSSSADALKAGVPSYDAWLATDSQFSTPIATKRSGTSSSKRLVSAKSSGGASLLSSAASDSRSGVFVDDFTAKKVLLKSGWISQVDDFSKELLDFICDETVACMTAAERGTHFVAKFDRTLKPAVLSTSVDLCRVPLAKGKSHKTPEFEEASVCSSIYAASDALHLPRELVEESAKRLIAADFADDSKSVHHLFQSPPPSYGGIGTAMSMAAVSVTDIAADDLSPSIAEADLVERVKAKIESVTSKERGRGTADGSLRQPSRFQFVCTFSNDSHKSLTKLQKFFGDSVKVMLDNAVSDSEWLLSLATRLPLKYLKVSKAKLAESSAGFTMRFVE